MRLQLLPAASPNVVPMDTTRRPSGITFPPTRRQSFNQASLHSRGHQPMAVPPSLRFPESRPPSHQAPPSIPATPTTAAATTAQCTWTQWSGPPCLHPGGLVQNPRAWPLQCTPECYVRSISKIRRLRSSPGTPWLRVPSA